MKLLAPIDLAQTWEALCQDSRFQDLGYKVELQRNGKIVMSPASIRHGLIQSLVSNMLAGLLPDGQTATEAALQTPMGILVPDVIWCGPAWLALESAATAASSAPEICVEIMSASNSLAEMKDKRIAYFEAGCLEFILIDLKGFASFFSPEGQLGQSALVPGFPTEVPLPS